MRAHCTPDCFGARLLRVELRGTSTASMRIAILQLCVAVLPVLYGCDSSQNQTDIVSDAPRPVASVGFITEPGCFERSVVRVELTEQPPGCSVQGGANQLERQMLCAEVGTYIRSNLNPPEGAIVGITTRGQPPVESTSALINSRLSHPPT